MLLANSKPPVVTGEWWSGRVVNRQTHLYLAGVVVSGRVVEW